jgi:hypothetical protein
MTTNRMCSTRMAADHGVAVENRPAPFRSALIWNMPVASRCSQMIRGSAQEGMNYGVGEGVSEGVKAGVAVSVTGIP